MKITNPASLPPGINHAETDARAVMNPNALPPVLDKDGSVTYPYCPRGGRERFMGKLSGPMQSKNADEHEILSKEGNEIFRYCTSRTRLSWDDAVRVRKQMEEIFTTYFENFHDHLHEADIPELKKKMPRLEIAWLRRGRTDDKNNPTTSFISFKNPDNGLSAEFYLIPIEKRAPVKSGDDCDFQPVLMFLGYGAYDRLQEGQAIAANARNRIHASVVSAKDLGAYVKQICEKAGFAPAFMAAHSNGGNRGVNSAAWNGLPSRLIAPDMACERLRRQVADYDKQAVESAEANGELYEPSHDNLLFAGDKVTSARTWRDGLIGAYRQVCEYFFHPALDFIGSSATTKAVPHSGEGLEIYPEDARADVQPVFSRLRPYVSTSPDENADADDIEYPLTQESEPTTSRRAHGAVDGHGHAPLLEKVPRKLPDDDSDGDPEHENWQTGPEHSPAEGSSEGKSMKTGRLNTEEIWDESFDADNALSTETASRHLSPSQIRRAGFTHGKTHAEPVGKDAAGRKALLAEVTAISLKHGSARHARLPGEESDDPLTEPDD